MCEQDHFENDAEEFERRGLVRRQRDLYRLTRNGRDALAMTHAITSLVARSQPR